MRVLLDEMLPAGIVGLLPDHEVVTVQEAGLRGLTNGALLRRAASDGFAVLLTADRNLPAQQNIAASGIAVVLVRGSRMSEVVDQAGEIELALISSRPGSVTRTGSR